MLFPKFNNPASGVALPLSALKSDKSCGVGEFLDLIPFSDFCSKVGLNVIQLLPVNDTGTESSPYSALSAFALHPLYIRLQDMPESKGFEKQIHAIKQKHEDTKRFSYNDLRSEKLSLLNAFYTAFVDTILKDSSLAEWISKNSWIKDYAVYMNIKKNNFDASWKEWNKYKIPTKQEIQELWDSEKFKKQHMFFAWLQMRLDEQFKKAVAYCVKKGIVLKGDIPIMMNEDSCDAWSKSEFFRDDLRAGNPPDGENPLGQNWGFPIYNWDNLKADNYSWWVQRLKHSEQYYHAYRLDHILGFFRIWAIPYGERTGYLGWTIPNEPITSAELAELGFSGNRLRWLTEPHVSTNKIETVNNNDYLGTHGILHQIMDRIGEEELWLFKSSIKNESDIWNSAIPTPVKEELARLWRDRMLLNTGRTSTGKKLYTPVWTYRESTSWKSLSDEEKQAFVDLIAKKNKKNEELWEKQAKELLGILTASVDMLPCAEDLGSIPESVPGVLSALNIYSLKVIRWERDWLKEGQPFRNIKNYPELSVATSSVHDSSTLQGWWENEQGAHAWANSFFTKEEAELFNINNKEESNEETTHQFTKELALKVISQMATTSSDLFILPLQDYLSLVDGYNDLDAQNDRINVPGSVNAFNWTYRMPTTCENLQEDVSLEKAIKSVLKIRKEKK